MKENRWFWGGGIEEFVWQYLQRALETRAYCKQHARGDNLKVLSQRGLHDSCSARPTGEETYCKLHSEDRIVDICSGRSANDSCAIVGVAVPVSADGAPAIRVRLQREILDRSGDGRNS